MLGAHITSEGAEIKVWAPTVKELTVRLNSNQEHTLRKDDRGIFSAIVPAKAGDRYCYIIRNKCLPDPVSRRLPQGVHGPTEIVDPEAFKWRDAEWKSIPFHEYVIYELHVGTFSHQGTFDGVIPKLPYLRDLGVTVIELMPVAAFPGERNWGYDGVSLYAVQESYGGPAGLKRLVNAAHREGIAVALDVVYNHVGNEGNYLREFGPYFTAAHQTAWGDAINYDRPDSEHVRRFVVENALYWIREYHIDGLRLDAIQAIRDDSQKHIVQEINDAVKDFAIGSGRLVSIMAETDANDRKLLLPKVDGGFGLDATWTDDFHHAVHTFLTGERAGYYQDYGDPKQIVTALNEGFVFQGQYFKTWSRNRGSKPSGIALLSHIFCIQNHDQVGNRCWGERLIALTSRGAAKAAAALLLLAPETPLLFMGEEYGETAPFLFFVDYMEPKLQIAVIEGRKREFEEFGWNDSPNPQDIATFLRSKLRWEFDQEMLDWYRVLLRLRKQFVTHSSRTCSARIDGRQLLLDIPAERPAITVAIGTGKGVSCNSENTLLYSCEDGFEVAICPAERQPDFRACLERVA